MWDCQWLCDGIALAVAWQREGGWKSALRPFRSGRTAGRMKCGRGRFGTSVSESLAGLLHDICMCMHGWRTWQSQVVHGDTSGRRWTMPACGTTVDFQCLASHNVMPYSNRHGHAHAAHAGCPHAVHGGPHANPLHSLAKLFPTAQW